MNNREMKEKIIILNFRYYDSKKTGNKGTIVSFAFADPKRCQSTKYVKGHEVLQCYYEADLFDKVTDGITFKEVDATFVSQPSQFNPLQDEKVIKSIEYKGTVYDLI